MKFLWLHLLIATIVEVSECHFANVAQLRQRLESYFSFPRSTLSQKLYSVEFVKATFERNGLTVQLQDIHTYTGEKGYNVIGILRGDNFKTNRDRITSLVAHYDTLNTTGAVESLSAIRTLFLHKHSVIFVALDFNEVGMMGSSQYVNKWLIPHLKKYGSQFAGALVADSVLNFDPFPTSQGVPKEFQALFPKNYKLLHSHHYMGDYVQVVSRSKIDQKLSRVFQSNFGRSLIASRPWAHHQPWLMTLELKLDRMSAPETVLQYRNFTNGDHRSFWFPKAFGRHEIKDLPCIWLSDTERYRGQLQYCHKAYCDGLALLMSDNLQFLATVTDAVIWTILELSESSSWNAINECEPSLFTDCYMCTLNLIKHYHYKCQ